MRFTYLFLPENVLAVDRTALEQIMFCNIGFPTNLPNCHFFGTQGEVLKNQIFFSLKESVMTTPAAHMVNWIHDPSQNGLCFNRAEIIWLFYFWKNLVNNKVFFVNCQAQFHLASSVQVQLRTESSLIISVRPQPTQASRAIMFQKHLSPIS